MVRRHGGEVGRCGKVVRARGGEVEGPCCAWYSLPMLSGVELSVNEETLEACGQVVVECNTCAASNQLGSETVLECLWLPVLDSSKGRAVV